MGRRWRAARPGCRPPSPIGPGSPQLPPFPHDPPSPLPPLPSPLAPPRRQATAGAGQDGTGRAGRGARRDGAEVSGGAGPAPGAGPGAGPGLGRAGVGSARAVPCPSPRSLPRPVTPSLPCRGSQDGGETGGPEPAQRRHHAHHQGGGGCPAGAAGGHTDTRTHTDRQTDTAPPGLPVPRVRRPKPPGGSGPCGASAARRAPREAGSLPPPGLCLRENNPISGGRRLASELLR